MATPEVETEDDAYDRITKGYACCGNCRAYIGEECRLKAPKVFWDSERGHTEWAHPSPPAHHVCLEHQPEHRA